jgi:hypothetical protein
MVTIVENKNDKYTARCRCGAHLIYEYTDIIYDEYGEGSIICPECNREVIVRQSKL